jgi:hypothetical protein
VKDNMPVAIASNADDDLLTSPLMLPPAQMTTVLVAAGTPPADLTSASPASTATQTSVTPFLQSVLTLLANFFG